jgi:hypothetical protein
MSLSRLSERVRPQDVGKLTPGLTRQCEGKARYPSRRNAVGKAANIERRFGEPMSAYRCRVCNAWHIGHDKRR